LEPIDGICKSCNLPAAKCGEYLQAINSSEQQLLRDQELEDHINSHWEHELLYVFAERYDIPALKRAIIDHWWFFYQLQKDASMPHAEAIYSLRRVDPVSPLYRFIVDLYARSYFLGREEKCGIYQLLCHLVRK
jgi:hypothetical protein